MSRIQRRQPTIVFVDTFRSSNSRRRLVSPNRLQSGRLCDGCGWPDRCRRDRLCWRAEKADIEEGLYDDVD